MIFFDFFDFFFGEWSMVDVGVEMISPSGRRKGERDKGKREGMMLKKERLNEIRGKVKKIKNKNKRKDQI